MAERTRGPGRAGCLRATVRVAMAGLLATVVGGLVGLAVVAWLYDQHVVREPGPHLDRAHIRTIIAQETPVYYADGETRIGVFFAEEHRQYVPFSDLPAPYVMSIVAAEDGAFWTHPGINVRGIVRAMRDNLKAGGVVAGGSTLTQQTAKNLYYRPDRSARAKLVELVNALKLEAHYDKQEILTFYVNQFHVTGNGRGLGIAARHFFDKEVDELTVAECAFLAGLVKAPAHYDPFLGDDARRARSVERAHDRTRYVLSRLVAESVERLAGAPPERADPADLRRWEAQVLAAGRVRAEAQRLLDEGFELPFRRGTFRYDSSAILDEVARRLGEPPLSDVLAQAGVSDPATAGLKIVTTLDPELQAEATYSLWHHLTEVGTQLEQHVASDFALEGHRGPRYDPNLPLREHAFQMARVVAHHGEPGSIHLEVDLGGHRCIVDRDAVVRAAVAVARGAKGSRSAKASTAQVDALVAALPTDSVLLVSVRSLEPTPSCNLELRPELQGSVVVLEDGQVRAMVGGNDNRNFNRATALRQMGSTFKPLIFHAALQLGWSPTDPLDNRRGVFPYSTTFYYPRPDHEPEPVVSMAWAGVRSENLASIWLLYHLTDRLDGEEVRALARSLDMARRPEESEEDYRTRIQLAGVLPTRSRVVEGLFLQARQEVLAGIETGEHPEDELLLQSLLYGWGFGTERVRAGRQGPTTAAKREVALDHSWTALEPRLSSCRSEHEILAASLSAGRAPNPEMVPSLRVLPDEETLQVACGARHPDGFAPPDAAVLAPWLAPDDSAGAEQVAADQAPAERRWPFRRRPEPAAPVEGESPDGPQLAEFGDVVVDGGLHAATLVAVQGALDRRQMAWDLLPSAPDLYDPEVLFWHQDFRVLLSLRYVTQLAEQYGVQSELQHVLSLPLGAAEITLEESASLYGGLVSGRAWEFPGKAGRDDVEPVPTSTLLIAEIQDVQGRVLYAAAPRSTDVSEAAVGAETADILRNVVLWGTGRRAKRAVLLDGQPVPVGGKTGTTNEFRNAAFVGVAPRWGDDGFDAADGYVVAAYVGYDDNRPMVQGGIKLAGASGALPAWMGTVDALAQLGRLGEPSGPPADQGAWPLTAPEGLVRVPAASGTGLEVADEALSGGGSVLTEPEPAVRPDHLDFRPIQRPPRIAPRTEEALVRPAIVRPEGG